MNALEYYLNEFVDPTLDDFKRHANSRRHCFLACVTTFHAIDRAAYPRKSGNLRDQWRRECWQFLIVDIVAHHFKHVQSHLERAAPAKGSIPIGHLLFGHGTLNTYGCNEMALNQSGMALRNMHGIIGEANAFLRRKAVEFATQSRP